MKDDKKKIAAMTAVLYYLQAEEDAAQYGMAADRPAPPTPEGFWNFSHSPGWC